MNDSHGLTDSPPAVPPVAPPEPAGDSRGYARPVEIVTILSVLAVDQLTKQVVRHLLPLHDSVKIIPGFLDFTHVQNTGAAFGLLNEIGRASCRESRRHSAVGRLRRCSARA